MQVGLLYTRRLLPIAGALVIGAVVTALAPQIHAEETIASLKSVAKSLGNELGDRSDVVSIQSSASFKRILSTESDLLWTEMLFYEDARVQVVGLLCIQQRRPALAAVFAARAVLAPKRGKALTAISEEILSVPLNEQQATDIAQLLQQSAPRWGDLADLWSYLGEGNVLEIFKRIELSKCTGETVAAFVASVSNYDKASINEAAKVKLDRATEMLRILPGHPRCVYLVVAELPAEEFVPLLDSLLDDSNVENASIALILINRGEKYVNHLETRLPSLSQPRRTLVQQYLDRMRKSK